MLNLRLFHWTYQLFWKQKIVLQAATLSELLQEIGRLITYIFKQICLLISIDKLNACSQVTSTPCEYRYIYFNRRQKKLDYTENNCKHLIDTLKAPNWSMNIFRKNERQVPSITKTMEILSNIRSILKDTARLVEHCLTKNIHQYTFNTQQRIFIIT